MNIPEHIKVEFKIKFESLNDAEVVLKTIEPELQSAPSDRSSVNLSLQGNTLKLVIDAEDTPSLRASVNSYLRWIILSCDVQNLKFSNL
ncbi:KEOPS complex subunit Pcc1 [Methanobacterium oryzae]|uniref:KEOPS complex subunit Pcc1 n=1 Tax=Methanobacterium oryzae TaxID=69540 RepID=UPI003D1DFFDC